MSVIDPQLWRDAEDGRALRELREALPGGWVYEAGQHANRAGQYVVRLLDEMDLVQVRYTMATIAGAADACRKALREQS